MEYGNAKKKILEKFSDSNVIASFKLPTGYIFSLKPKNWGDDRYVLDGFFKVDSSGKISEYSPVMDPKEFKTALQNRIE